MLNNCAFDSYEVYSENTKIEDGMINMMRESMVGDINIAFRIPLNNLKSNQLYQLNGVARLVLMDQ